MSVEWRRPAAGVRIAVLLGAFDPPTNAHVEILQAPSAKGYEPVWGMTRVLLDRPDDGLFTFEDRVDIVHAVAERTAAGFVLFAEGTYLEANRALRVDGFEPLFVIGSDKLEQLRDPSFYRDGYPDGDAGVRATFDEVAFHVVERDPAGLSATLVRRRWGRGQDIADLVPQEVVARLRSRGQGYTSAR